MTYQRKSFSTVLWITLVVFAVGTPGRAQDNPVYVDESPRGAELLRRAASQAEANPREAARLYQEVLDDAWKQLAPLDARHPDQFLSLRSRAITQLMADPVVLERYRQAQSGTAQRDLEAGRLETVALQRPLTPAGLEAMLRLAEAAVDHGQFEAARYWINQAREHLDSTPRTNRHTAYLAGVTAWFQQDTQVLEAMLATLEADAQAAALFESLSRLTEEPRPQRESRFSSPLEINTSGNMDALVGMPIWSFPLIESLYQRRNATTTRRASERRRTETNTVAPTVYDELVLLNQGQIIQALDRFSGEEIWRFRDDATRSTISRSEPALDLNAIAIEGSSLVTYTGHAHSRTRSRPANIVCLDADTGAFKWWVDLTLLRPSETFEGLFPIGSPLIREGTVYVLARKVSRQYLASCFVVALDLDTGTLKWSSYIGSSGSLRNRSSWPASLLTYDKGMLFVSTPIGVIASLNATTGQIAWLHRFDVPVAQNTSTAGMMPWHMAQPIVSENRVIALSPDRTWVLEFDRSTGDLLQTRGALRSSSFGGPQYLLANDDLLYAIGNDIRAFSLNNPEQPIWHYPPLDAPMNNETFVTGRVVLADEVLVVPTNLGIVLVDPTSGDQLQTVENALDGHPLVVDGQLLIATGDAVHSYLSDAQAERLLRRSFARSTDNPKPAIMLVQLGYRTNRHELMREATGLALDAISNVESERQANESRDQLVEILLEIARGTRSNPNNKTQSKTESLADRNASRAVAFELLGNVIRTASQRVSYALAYGDWLSLDDPTSAVDSYASVLRDPELRRQWVWEEDIGRRGSNWATGRLLNLILTDGPSIRKLLQSQADRDQAASLSSIPADDTEALVSLARAFPFSKQGAQATMKAARLLEQQGAPRRAMGLLMLIGRSANSIDQTLLASQAATLAQHSGWTDLAKALQSSGGQTWSTDFDYEGALSDATVNNKRFPIIGPVSPNTTARVLNGSLVPEHPGMVSRQSHDLALLQQDDRIGLFDASKMEMRWWADQPPSFSTNDRLAVLGLSPLSTLLWIEGDQPSVVLINNDTGLPEWESPPLNGFFGKTVSLQPRSSRTQVARSVDARFDQNVLVPLAGKNNLMVVQRTGKALAMNLDNGQLMWRGQDLLQHLFFAYRSTWGVTLVGDGSRPLGVEHPWSGRTWAIIIDPETGNSFGKISIPSREPPDWIEPAGPSRLLVGSPQGISCVDVVTGELVWANRGVSAQSSSSALALNGHACAIFDSNRDLRMVDIDHARISEPLEGPPNREWSAQEVVYSTVRNGILYAMTQTRIVAFAGTGQVVGADFIAEPRAFEAILPTSRGLMVPSLRPDPGSLIQAGLRIARSASQEYNYQFFRLSPDCRIESSFELPPLPLPARYGIAIDNALLFATEEQTIVIDLPMRSSQ